MQIISPKDGFPFAAHHTPAQGARKGGVVVVQEIFGVTDHIRDICNRFAAAGYESLAPALFDRVEPGFEYNGPHDQALVKKGLGFVSRTPWDQAGADIQACIDKLAGPVFVTGFCWGGTASWIAASRCRNVAAASGFYGRLIEQYLSDAPRAPIILHYGKKDASIPPENVARVHAAYPNVPLHMYDAGHSFCRDGAEGFDGASRDLALQRTLEFFAAHTGGSPHAA
jgi:carboxymethylenebutenolidase